MNNNILNYFLFICRRIQHVVTVVDVMIARIHLHMLQHTPPYLTLLVVITLPLRRQSLERMQRRHWQLHEPGNYNNNNITSYKLTVSGLYTYIYIYHYINYFPLLSCVCVCCFITTTIVIYIYIYTIFNMYITYQARGCRSRSITMQNNISRSTGTKSSV